MGLAEAAGRTKPAVIVAICFAVAALEGYDIQAFGVAAPKLVADLSLDAGQMGWAASVAMLGLVVGAFVGGWLADRVGRKPILLVSTAMFGVFSAVTALSPDYGSLIIARLLTGLGFGGAMPNLIAIAVEVSAPRRRAAAVTTMFCGMPAGGSVVALAAGLAGDALDWRAVFYVGGLLPLLLVPVIWRWLPETRPQHDPAADRRAGYALFGEGRAAASVALWLVIMLTLAVLYLMLNWLPTLVVAKGLTAADGAMASLSFNLTSIVGALAVGFLADKVGFRWPLTGAYLLLAAAMLGLASARGLAPVLILAGISGFMVLGAQYTIYALAPLLYPPQVRAFGAGSAVAIGRFGSIAGPLVAGEFRQMGMSAGQVFAAMTPAVFLAAVAVFGLSFLARPRED
jgi:AAHS family 3-hydroxyphenylpropionic acid transporter